MNIAVGKAYKIVHNKIRKAEAAMYRNISKHIEEYLTSNEKSIVH